MFPSRLYGHLLIEARKIRHEGGRNNEGSLYIDDITKAQEKISYVALRCVASVCCPLVFIFSSFFSYSQSAQFLDYHRR